MRRLLLLLLALSGCTGGRAPEEPADMVEKGVPTTTATAADAPADEEPPAPTPSAPSPSATTIRPADDDGAAPDDEPDPTESPQAAPPQDDVTTASAPPGEQAPADPSDADTTVHWAVSLGVRSLRVSLSFPVIDRVVLVPDAATYLAELEQWSPTGRWPVLFEDDVLAPMFIRTFAPQQVVVRDSVGPLAGSRSERQARLERLVERCWGGDAEAGSIREVFTAQAHLPAGVVVASVDDAAWTAAVALAAGRGQPLLWLDESFADPDAVLDADDTGRLRAMIDDLVESLDYPADELGDVIDTITLCRAVAGRVTVDVPVSLQIPIPQRFREGPRALTDVIGRREDWQRYAFTGWIFGDERRCAYVAMCSLFLAPQRFDLINTYPLTGTWRAYRLNDLVPRLAEMGFESTHRGAEEVTLERWRKLLPGGLGGDVLFMNSRGNADRFHLDGSIAEFVDVPLHRSPVIVHFVHSWSMQTPGRPDTVAGRWLDHGAYTYVGSVHEPLLNAFVPPLVLTERLGGLIPFLVAARWWESDGLFSRPWRVNTYGDPLMLVAPPGQVQQERVEPPDDGAVPLSDRVRALMEQLKEHATAETYGEAMRGLSWLSRDDLAEQVWKLAVYQKLDGPAAPYALDLFFRHHQPEEFLGAWEKLSAPDERQRDMLWHLLGARLGPEVDQRTLEALASGLRRSRPQLDAERLAPHYDRVLGRAQVRRMLERAADEADRPGAAQALRKLRDGYPNP